MPQNSRPYVVLASESARRIDILQQLGVTFQHEASLVDDGRPLDGEQPRDYTLRLAASKAQAVASRHPAAIVIGADTVVVAGNAFLGKPVDESDAASMLCMLSGNWHQVVTGLCLLDKPSGRSRSDAASTDVKFRALDADEISAYVATGEPLDKAGAYAIQGKAALFVEEIRGCYFNVVGFPVSLFYRLWRELGLPLSGLFPS